MNPTIFLYTLTIGISAFLLFLIQPMVSKVLLPVFGGSSSIWITCLIFYQLLLLAGYSSSHFLARLLNHKNLVIYQAVITLLTLFFITIQVKYYGFSPDDMHPVILIFIIMLTSIGLPYLVLSSSSPTYQYLIAWDSRSSNHNPYYQYAISNIGSLAGLLIYPLLFETSYTIDSQLRIWSIIYYVYVALALMCILMFLYHQNKHNLTEKKTQSIGSNKNIDLKLRIRWIYLSMIPSAALIVTTQYITVDVVNFPMLWVLPLSLYLISFILVFLFPKLSKPTNLRTLIVLLAVFLLLLTQHEAFDFPITWKIPVALLFLFSLCMLYHGDLEQQKPEKKKLTSFYLYMSLGGVLGSILTGVIAPLIFKTTFEFYLVIIFALHYLISRKVVNISKTIVTAFKVSLVIIAVFSYSIYELGLNPETIYKDRSFYGTYRVSKKISTDNNITSVKFLTAGTHIHGGELIGRNKPPITYYHEDTGVGRALKKLNNIVDVGLVGLGTGVIAAYGKAGQNYNYYEIDQKIVDIAYNHFSYLKSSVANIKTFVGDARINLKKVPAKSYDVLIMDAFSSGSIPSHLMTKEAISEYLNILRNDGVILYHISNQYLDLTPVLLGVAEKLGLHIRKHMSSYDPSLHKLPATWVLLTKNEDSLNTITENDNSWYLPSGPKKYWTDNFSDIWSLIKFDGNI